MPVCVNFNYGRVSPTQAGASGTTPCATKYGTNVAVKSGGAFTPLPFKAYQLLSLTGGYTTPTGRNVDAEPQISGAIPPTWPHFAKGVLVPAAPGDTGAGVYALFGQIP
jgi:hypothetical protein